VNTLRHIAEPSRLLMTWQSLDEDSPDRSRRVVGEVHHGESGELTFRYLKDSPDFIAAREQGFHGFPAFDMKLDEIRKGVAESLLRRLPPATRDDYETFLRLHRLPVPFPGSVLALLGYTGARLPSDGFALVPDFEESNVPCDLIIEVAGLRHVFKGDVAAISPGDPVEFRRDLDNPIEDSAVEILWNGSRIGFVNRAMRKTFCRWLDLHTVQGSVERLNGRPERPLLYIRVEVS
jgi:hypothetical protein